jgi:hypothetical protein
MKKYYCFIIPFLTLGVTVAQVKSNYLYNTSTPYGTLDIRTTISSSDYFYLNEGKTFSYRESSPGVRTNTYLDMTSWDSNPYQQGHLRRKTGTTDKFIMNYRLLFPANYNTSYAEGYPMIVMFHGAVERANCYYNSCYHSGWAYDPNVNSPPAPTSVTHKLLNNDHNLQVGGKLHLDARNLAGSKLPNDPTLAARAFPGFVLVPQMFNVWDSLRAQDVIRIIQLVAKKYKVDQNRIYIHGLSIGAHAVWQAAKRAPWLFAAALPISANHDANVIKQNMVGKIGHIPYWIFQGGKDTNPSPAYTNTLVNYLRNGGANVRYSVYADLGHVCWNRAFSEPEWFKFMTSKNKANIHVYKGNTVISGTTYPKLILPEGFHAYQWEKNGVIISATSFQYTASTPGTYRARFSRVPAPTATQWNRWSAPVTITKATTAARIGTADTVDLTLGEDILTSGFQVRAYPNPATQTQLNVSVESDDSETPIQIQVIDNLGKSLMHIERMPGEFQNGIPIEFPQRVSEGFYILSARQGRRTMRQKVIIREE